MSATWRHADPPPTEKKVPLWNLEAIPGRENTKCVSTEDSGELKLVAAAADYSLSWGPEDFPATLELGVVSDEEIAILHLIRCVVGSENKLFLELGEGERGED